MKNIFAGLDKLGFDDVNNVDLYRNKNKIEQENDNTIEDDTPQELHHLYDKSISCPVCDNEFTVKAIKTSSYKMKSRDSDFFIRYEDRKSTRLNFSHANISYAVFCLK